MTRLVPKKDVDTFIFGDGFLVPGKSTGSLSLVTPNANNSSSFSVRKLTVDKSDWFYHEGKFIDVNGDGLLDIVTCRALSHLYGGGAGELIWLEAPNWVQQYNVPGFSFFVLIAPRARRSSTTLSTDQTSISTFCR
jgi:hypothetical protein